MCVYTGYTHTHIIYIYNLYNIYFCKCPGRITLECNKKSSLWMQFFYETVVQKDLEVRGYTAKTGPVRGYIACG